MYWAEVVNCEEYVYRALQMLVLVLGPTLMMVVVGGGECLETWRRFSTQC